jgi:arabinan endo-1,5-alpha-L-arabinosidase
MSKSRVILKISATILVCGTTALADDRGRGDDLTFYDNPLAIRLSDGSLQTNCADPTVIQGKAPDPYWYVLCTTDSLSDEDIDARGVRRSHLLPTLRSRDLVSWEYMGDAFATPPSWVAPGGSLWAPEIVYRNGRYYLYYVATDVADAVSGEPGCTSDNAIGVATSNSPLGPWVDSGVPVVAPRRAGGGCNFFWTYDPDVLVTSSGRALLYYGSYYGGIEARELAADGLSTLPETAKAITIPNRYEAANVVEKDGSYYLFASASNCCNGPLTGYQVFAGRSKDPFGPFVDRNGVSLLDSRVGGTPVLTLNGNRWVGGGHSSAFRDASGNWYAAYHAIDRDDPYFEGAVGYTRRPMLIDRLTWNDGWPSVRNGLGASDSRQLAPATKASKDSRTATARKAADALADLVDPNGYLLWLDRVDVSRLRLVEGASDEFNAGAAPSSQWTWVRQPAAADFGIEGGAFRFATQAGELFGDSNSAAVLTEPAPSGNWIAEVKVDLDVPDSGCCFNYVQAGLVAYANDDTYVKLTHVSIWETRQIEFGKEISAPIPGFPAYGSAVGGPPGRTTWLRIAKVARKGKETYVSYSSRDGVSFSRGATWDHALGSNAKIGLVAFGGRGFTARFDHVRVRSLPEL